MYAKRWAFGQNTKCRWSKSSKKGTKISFKIRKLFFFLHYATLTAGSMLHFWGIALNPFHNTNQCSSVSHLWAFLASWQVNDECFSSDTTHRSEKHKEKDYLLGNVKLTSHKPVILILKHTILHIFKLNLINQLIFLEERQIILNKNRTFGVWQCFSDLESMPSGVTLRDPISIARDIPGASRSITSLVAWRQGGEKGKRLWSWTSLDKLNFGEQFLTFCNAVKTDFSTLSAGFVLRLKLWRGHSVHIYSQWCEPQI